MFHYQAYDLNFCADIEIPELCTHSSAKVSEVFIRQAQANELTQPMTENYFIEGKETQLFLNIPKVAQFLISYGKNIIYRLCANVHLDEFRLFLLGSCFGAILQQRGFIVLHGNAISIDNKYCAIFVGNQGAGKSTTAAWFLQQGAHILADDVCAISFDKNSQAFVVPGYPQIKIWQDSADKLGIKTESLRRVRPQDAKYALPAKKCFCSTPLPIKEIIELNKDHQPIEFITGIEKFKKLIHHSYRYNFLNYQGHESMYNKQLAELARGITFRSMRREELVRLS